MQKLSLSTRIILGVLIKRFNELNLTFEYTLENSKIDVPIQKRIFCMQNIVELIDIKEYTEPIVKKYVNLVPFLPVYEIKPSMAVRK